MLSHFARRAIARLEKRYAYDAGYLREMLAAAPQGFRRFMRIQGLGTGYRGGAPLSAWLAAGIAGAVTEDCGPCVQISCDMALEQGLAPEDIAALLSDRPASPDAELGFNYALALLHGSDWLETMREQVLNRWGEEALIALSLKAMTTRNYPVLKRAMGHAKACHKVRVGGTDVVVEQSLKAA